MSAYVPTIRYPLKILSDIRGGNNYGTEFRVRYCMVLVGEMVDIVARVAVGVSYYWWVGGYRSRRYRRIGTGRRKNWQTSRQIWCVFWDTKNLQKTQFWNQRYLSTDLPKKIDRSSDRQRTDLIFWDTLFHISLQHMYIIYAEPQHKVLWGWLSHICCETTFR